MNWYEDTADSANQVGRRARKRSIWNFLNLLAYTANVIIVLFVGELGAFFGRPTYPRLLEKFPTLMTPKAWLQSTVWPLIFVAQLLWVIAQLVHGDSAWKVTKRVRYYYLGVTLSQIAFTGLWLYQQLFIATFPLVIALFFFMHISHMEDPSPSIMDFWLLQFPMSLNSGWVLVLLVITVNMLIMDNNVAMEYQVIGALVSLLCGMGAFGISFLLAKSLDLVLPIVVAIAGALAIFLELLDPVDKILINFTPRQINWCKWSAFGAFCLLIVGTIIRSIRHVYVQRKEEEDNLKAAQREVDEIVMMEQSTVNPAIQYVPGVTPTPDTTEDVIASLTPEERAFIYGNQEEEENNGDEHTPSGLYRC
eukprot:CAMPEP_0202459998 /NCGR_PEP_ID=MMETSP1360-20130828/40618_1 /ASSEMBLY_ACC=CAM_ASM_000848 /TAXON_ID=515479 /ORGANISM="Licmophora paradoxa, Strain CCMP2313" /LENGTH=363 /DNA_ID=CAMNT_0049081419 /DNA_START=55 /DNA_END=1146 /DNA_ORIENTATION=+